MQWVSINPSYWIFGTLLYRLQEQNNRKVSFKKARCKAEFLKDLFLNSSEIQLWQCTVENVCHHLSFQDAQGNFVISCQHFLIQEPAGMLEQECLHHGAALAGIPAGNLAKPLKLTMTLDSTSSSPPAITAKIVSLRIPDTAAGKEEKIIVLLHLTVAVFHLSHLQYHLPLADPHKSCLENKPVLLNKIALRYWHNTCHPGNETTETEPC